MLAGILVDARTYFVHIGFDVTPIDKLERYRERSLNPTSHYNPRTDYFKRELQEIFTILEALKSNRNEALLFKDDKIKFDVLTTNGRTFSYTATLLDDICLYQKNDGTASFFIDTDERGYVIEKCVEGVNESTFDNLTKGTLKQLYNETCKGLLDFKRETAVVEEDMYSLFKNENGIKLKDLKHY